MLSDSECLRTIIVNFLTLNKASALIAVVKLVKKKDSVNSRDIWGSAWLLVIMHGPINQKLKQISI